MSKISVGYVQPIQAQDITNIGRAMVVAKGSALYLPNFTKPPEMVGDQIVPESVECVPLTLEKAGEAAQRIVAMQSKLPLSDVSVDLLNVAYAVMHYQNKARGDK